MGEVHIGSYSSHATKNFHLHKRDADAGRTTDLTASFADAPEAHVTYSCGANALGIARSRHSPTRITSGAPVRHLRRCPLRTRRRCATPAARPGADPCPPASAGGASAGHVMLYAGLQYNTPVLAAGLLEEDG